MLNLLAVSFLFIPKHIQTDNEPHKTYLYGNVFTSSDVLDLFLEYCTWVLGRFVYYAHISSHKFFYVVLFGAISDGNLQNILYLQKSKLGWYEFK